MEMDHKKSTSTGLSLAWVGLACGGLAAVVWNTEVTLRAHSGLQRLQLNDARGFSGLQVMSWNAHGASHFACIGAQSCCWTASAGKKKRGKGESKRVKRDKRDCSAGGWAHTLRWSAAGVIATTLHSLYTITLQVTGRARLGGQPVGVIAVETGVVSRLQPADPGMPDSSEMLVPQAGQWPILHTNSSASSPPTAPGSQLLVLVKLIEQLRA
eukprot:1161625-Pelagomonas_calceolata.AAC.2